MVLAMLALFCSGLLQLVLASMKVVVWNPLTLKVTYRLKHIATTLDAGVVLLAGTGLKASRDSNHAAWHISDKFWCVSFGWQRAPFSNASAGCAIILRSKRFLPQHVTRIFVPPAELRGRGGAIRIKSPCGDFFFGTQYTPPIAGKLGQKMRV